MGGPGATIRSSRVRGGIHLLNFDEPVGLQHGRVDARVVELGREPFRIRYAVTVLTRWCSVWLSL